MRQVLLPHFHREETGAESLPGSATLVSDGAGVTPSVSV